VVILTHLSLSHARSLNSLTHLEQGARYTLNSLLTIIVTIPILITTNISSSKPSPDQHHIQTTHFGHASLEGDAGAKRGFAEHDKGIAVGERCMVIGGSAFHSQGAIHQCAQSLRSETARSQKVSQFARHCGYRSESWVVRVCACVSRMRERVVWVCALLRCHVPARMLSAAEECFFFFARLHHPLAESSCEDRS
jgi:hypothetical protein